MTSFNPGDRVYLIDGTECEYVAAVDDKHAVRKVYEDESGDGDHLGDVTLVRAVYAKAPTAKLDAEVARLNGIAAELADKVAAARAEEEELRRGAKERQALLAQHKATERIADFIAGKITHFVIFGYEGPLVLDTASAINYHEDSFGHRVWNGETKLLTLYGASGQYGEHRNGRGLSWRLSHYSDGSGGSTKVIPCMSLEEARDLAKEHLDKLFADTSTPRLWERAVEAATKLGFEVPAHVTEHLRAAEIESARLALASYEAKFIEARAKLAELERAS